MSDYMSPVLLVAATPLIVVLLVLHDVWRWLRDRVSGPRELPVLGRGYWIYDREPGSWATLSVLALSAPLLLALMIGFVILCVQFVLALGVVIFG